MYRNIAVILLLATLALLAADIVNPEGSFLLKTLERTTEGNLAFSVRTVTYNGQYAPRNAGAIWITNAQNQFVKTIKVWANQYRYTLIRWNANSGGNTTGAITGASLNNHILHNVTWNGRNYQNIEVPDGTYYVNTEFTEHNANANNMGKYKQVAFVKGPDPIDETLPNETYFRDMTLVWTPVISNGTVFGTVINSSGNPVTGATVIAGAFSVTTNASGAYELSLAPGIWELSCQANGYQSQTISGVEVISAQATEVNFQLGQVANADETLPSAGMKLLPAYPNPFSAITTLKFYSASSQPALMSIYNMKGQKVFATVVPAWKDQWREFRWNGLDQRSKLCANGIYTVRLQQDGVVRSQRIMLKK